MVVVGGGEVDDRLLDDKDSVGLDHEAYVRADLLYVVRVERQAVGEPLVDEPGAKGRWKRSKEIRHGFFVFLTCGDSCQRTCGVAL